MNDQEQGTKERTGRKAQRSLANRRVHMANERTFLAWIRTSIAIMAFGFVVERFSLFVAQMGYFLGKKVTEAAPWYSSVVGIILVGVGILMGVLSFIRYKSVEKQIDESSYRPSGILSVMLFLVMLAIGVFLLLYLVQSV